MNKTDPSRVDYFDDSSNYFYPDTTREHMNVKLLSFESYYYEYFYAGVDRTKPHSFVFVL